MVDDIVGQPDMLQQAGQHHVPAAIEPRQADQHQWQP
jgi:hypothetical protein